MIKSIMCCCGSGLGSSMLVRMNVEKTLQKIGVYRIPVGMYIGDVHKDGNH